MAVFLSASDESDGGHHRSTFWHGGWLMPETDWYTYFAPAWQEWVLDSEPKIPYLHMTEIRDPAWRKEQGITWQQAQDKMDMAAILINQMGSLCPVTVSANAGVFLDAHGKKKVMQNAGEKKPARFLIDHYCFNAYLLMVLSYVHSKYPEAEKVDFQVERKEGVYEKLKQFYDGFAESLKYVGHPELIKYMGELTAVGKERPPVQAADMLCWHVSRGDLGLLKGRDAMRAATIFHGRRGPIIELPDKLHFELAAAFAEKMNESKDGVPEVRRNHEKTDSGSSRQAKSRAGSGKRRKTKKAKG
jgi:hypothetical protein